MNEHAAPRPRTAGSGGEVTVRHISRVTLVGCVCNVVLAVGKLLAGAVGGSQAVFADGVHSLSDLSTDVAILIGVRYWSAPADACHPHGHDRIETAVTVGIGIALAAAGLLLGFNALASLHEIGGSAPTAIALIAACVSLLGKEVMYHWAVRVAKRIGSTALVANAWHHRSDALSSLPVVVAVAASMIEPSWLFIDRVAAVLVAYFILRSAWNVLRPALGELVDTGAPEEVRGELREIAFQTDGVREVHGIRTRYAGARLRVDMHVLVDGDMTVREGHDIAERVKQRLIAHGPEVMDVVVHVEPYHEARKEGSGRSSR